MFAIRVYASMKHRRILILWLQDKQPNLIFVKFSGYTDSIFFQVVHFLWMSNLYQFAAFTFRGYSVNPHAHYVLCNWAYFTDFICDFWVICENWTLKYFCVCMLFVHLFMCMRLCAYILFCIWEREEFESNLICHSLRVILCFERVYTIPKISQFTNSS